MKKILIVCLSLVSVVALSAAEIKTEYTVDRNGRGDFRNVQEAIDAVRPSDPRGLITIHIRNGVYKEKVVLPSFVNHVRFVGENRDSTIITFDDHANINHMGTFKSYTFLLSGNDITMENLTIENSSEPLGQAVSLHIEGDRIVFRNCRFLGDQDTIYAGRDGSRQYFENCYIEGTTDFIFGPATVWFEGCTIYCKRNSYITAANTPETTKYGLIFNHCTVKLAPSTTAMYLGRPWRPYSMTLFMNCDLPKGIKPAGWYNWGNPENEKTARYMEYNNRGEGANLSARVAWSKKLSVKDAKEYTVQNVLSGCDKWNPNN